MTPNNSPEIKNYISERSELFWYIAEEKKTDISLSFLTETILNYGNATDVKKLIELLGIQTVAEIFRENSNRERSNYFPQVKHYFSLYFDKNA